MRRMAPRDSKNHASAGMPSKLTNGSRAIGFVLRFGGGASAYPVYPADLLRRVLGYPTTGPRVGRAKKIAESFW